MRIQQGAPGIGRRLEALYLKQDERSPAPAGFKLHLPFHTDLFFFRVITPGFGDVMPAFGGQIAEEDRWNLINSLRAEHSLEAQGE